MFVILLIDFSLKWHGSTAMFKNLPVIANSTRPSITGSCGGHIRMTPSATNNSCTCILAVGFRRPRRYVMRSISAPLTRYLALQQAWNGALFKTLIRSLQSAVFGIWSSGCQVRRLSGSRIWMSEGISKWPPAILELGHWWACCKFLCQAVFRGSACTGDTYSFCLVHGSHIKPAGS